MHVTITPTVIDQMKRDLREALPAAGSSNRVEALARGLGFGSNAALIPAIVGGPIEREIDSDAFSAYLAARDVAAAGAHLVRVALRAQVRAVQEQQQFLTHNGFAVFHRTRDGMQAEWLAKVQRDRASMLSDAALEEFCRARDFMDRIERTKNVNRKGTSYGLKHCAERYYRRLHEADRGFNCYVSNGMLLAAAYHLGLKVEQETWSSPNAHLNLSAKSIDRVEKGWGEKVYLPPEPGQHYRMLGYYESRYFFMLSGGEKPVGMRSFGTTQLVRLAPPEHWAALYPPRYAREEFNGTAVRQHLNSEAHRAGPFDPRA